MNNAAIDGGGGGGDFDWTRLYQATGRIEDLIGVLKGNELAQEYVLRAADHSDGMMQQDYQYQTKPFDGRYQVTYNQLVPVPELYTEEAVAITKQYDEAMGQSFANGVGWASGISGYLVSLVGPLTEPSVSAMDTIVQDLKAVPLWSLFDEDFSRDKDGIGLSTTLGHWRGDSALAFATFYNNIDDVCSRYAFIKDAAATWVDGCGALVAAVRIGLLEFLESVGDHLSALCDQWAKDPHSVGAKSYDDPVIALGGVALEIAEALPVVDKVVSLPGKIVDIADKVGELKSFAGLISKYTGFSLSDMKTEPLNYEASTADAVYELVTSTVVDKHVTPLQDGFALIASDRTTNLVNEINSLQHPLNDRPNSTRGQTFYPNVVPESITKDPANYV